MGSESAEDFAGRMRVRLDMTELDVSILAKEVAARDATHDTELSALRAERDTALAAIKAANETPVAQQIAEWHKLVAGKVNENAALREQLEEAMGLLRKWATSDLADTGVRAKLHAETAPVLRPHSPCGVQAGNRGP